LNFEDYFQDAPADVEQRDRVSSEHELYHLLGALLCKGWDDGIVQEDQIRWVFDPLGWHFKSVLGLRESHGL
jgi:hypothetical protein